VTGLTPGQTYSVSVWATDFSGNVSAPGGLTFVAGASPHLTVTGPPDHAWLPVSDVTYTMTTDTPATFSCSVDNVAADCLGHTSLSLPALTPGVQHKVVMTPQTYFGPGAPVTRHVGIDVDLPKARIGALRAFNVTGTIHVPVVATDASSGVASRDVRYRTTDRYGHRSSWHYPRAWQRSLSRITLTHVSPGVTACFSTRARDRVGHRSAWSALRCSTVMFDDRAMTASAGWQRGFGDRFYRGTFTQTGLAGQTLTISHVRGHRIALLVTVCPMCGQLRITNAAGTYSRSVDLYSPTTRRSVILLLRDAPTTGSLTLRVLSAGNRVRIDGIGIGFRS
jgi:hypothetical protein